MLFGNTRTSQGLPADLGHSPQPRSHNSLRNAFRASKSLVGKVTSKVSPVHLRKPSQEGLNVSTRPPSDSSYAPSASIVSTAQTTLSLPVPDCGAQFTVPGFETINSIIAQDFKVALDTEVEPSNEFTHNTAEYHNPQQGSVTALECKIEQTQHAQPPSRADSALDVRSTLDPRSTNGEVNEPKKTSKMAKVRQWGHRMKARFFKLSPRCKPIELDESAVPVGIDDVTAVHEHEAVTVHENDEGEDEEENEDEDEHYPRCEFKTIEAIPDIALEILIRSQCDFIRPTDNLSVVHRTKGAWNFVAMVNFVRDEQLLQEYIVRIPGHGTPARWTSEDVYMIEREAQLINYIRKNTTVPVPEIIDFNTSHDNTLGYPYILMIKLPGKNAGSIWFDQPYLPNKAGYAYCTADVPSTYTEKKRINFLRSLARHMTAIQALSFDKIGMPLIPDQDAVPTIGPHYHWKNDGSDKAVERAAADSVQSYALTAIDTKYKLNEDAPKDSLSYKARGNRKIFDIIFSQPIFCPSESETFTIHHNDLDFQNILVDDDGNVTGLIDWDSSYTAPRCMGAAAVPIFLRNDWFPRYVNDLRLTPHMAWNYQHYREVYAAAMLEAGNPDAHFTLKSAMYQSVFAAVTEFGERYSFAEKLLRQLPNCMVDAHDFQIALGLGWPAAQDWLAAQLPKIFEPEVPRSDLLAQLDAEIALKEWWLCFDTYLEEVDEAVDVASGDGSKASKGEESEAIEDEEGDTDPEVAIQCD